MSLPAKKKYRGLIFSLWTLFAFLSLAAAANYYLNTRINANTQHIETLHLLDDETQHLLAEIQKIALITESSLDTIEKTAAYNSTLAEIHKLDERITRVLHIIQYGGTFDTDDGRITVDLSARADTVFNDNIVQLTGHWRAYRQEIQKISTYQNIKRNNAAAQFAQQQQPKIKGLLTLMRRQETAQSALFTDYSHYIQIGTIAVFLLYLLVFIYYFINRLSRADKKIDMAMQEIGEIMSTVDVGLFLLDRDLNIGDSYSDELENLLGQKNLQHQSLMDVISPLLSQKDLQAAHSFIRQVYSPRVKERLIGSLNPLSAVPITVKDKKGETETRYLNFTFKRIYENKEIVRVLVNVSDITDAVLLAQKAEEERADSDLQLELLSLIVNTEQNEVRQFVARAKQHAWDINNTLKRKDDNTPAELRDKLNTIFRSVHSLKGEAGALRFRGFTALVENIEVQLVQRREKPVLSGQDFMSLVIVLEDLIRLIQLLEDVLNLIGNQTVTAAVSESKDAFYRDLVADLAQRNNKQIDFVCNGLEKVPQSRLDNLIRNIGVQLLRNAAVHGIESPAERTAARKLPSGRIGMRFGLHEGSLLMTVEDDGRGLDYEAIRRKAVAIGLCDEARAAALTEKQLSALIFRPGFTTSTRQTGDAGRGVGLDIIKENVIKSGGKIQISSVPGAYTRFRFALPLPHHLPVRKTADENPNDRR